MSGLVDCRRCLGFGRLFSPEWISYVCPDCGGRGYSVKLEDYYATSESPVENIEPEGERRGIDCTCPSCRVEARSA